MTISSHRPQYTGYPPKLTLPAQQKFLTNLTSCSPGVHLQLTLLNYAKKLVLALGGPPVTTAPLAAPSFHLALHAGIYLHPPRGGGYTPPCDMSTHPLGRTSKGHKVVSTSA